MGFGKIKSQEVKTHDYKLLNAQKFSKNITWAIDSVDKNNVFSSHSLFWYKKYASCLLVKIGPFRMKGSTLNSGINIEFSLKTFGHLITGFQGIVLDQSVNGSTFSYDSDQKVCLDSKKLNFLFTDYLNMVVISTDDDWTKPHIMILRTSITNMTNKERMDLIRSKMKHLLDFDDLVKVEPYPFCCALEKSHWQIKNTYYPICTEFIQSQIRKTKFERLFRTMLVIFVLLGLVWITIYGMFWISQRRIRTIVVPE